MLVLAEAGKKATLGNDFTDFQAIKMKSRCHCIPGKVGAGLEGSFEVSKATTLISKQGLEVYLWALEQ